MYKHYCDICGEQITSKDQWSRYKLKRLDTSFMEPSWDRLDVHDDCWQELYNLVKEKREDK